MTAALLRVVVGAAIGAAALFVRQAAHPPLGTDFDLAFVVPPDVLRGFYDTEQDPAGITYAWTGRTADWHLGGLRRSSRWTAEFRLRAPGHSAESPQTVLVLVDGARVRTAAVHDDFQTLSVDIPRAARSGASVTLETPDAAPPGTSDPRVLGVLVDSLRLSPAQGERFPLLSNRVLALSVLIGAGFAAIATLAGLSLIHTVALVTIVCGLWSWLVLRGVAPFGSYPLYALRALAAAAAGTAICVAWSRRASAAGTKWTGIAGVLTAGFGFLKFVCLVHPELTRGDTIFHLNRMRTVMRGNYFFTSAAPGGEFPYPVSLYVISGWLTPLTSDWVLLMRVVVLAVDLVAGVLLFAVIRRWWKSPAPAVGALLLYHVIPATFQVQAVAYLTNAFAQFMASAGLLLLLLLPPNRLRGPAVVLAGLVLLTALTGHTGTFLVLCGTLVLMVLVALGRGSPDARRTIVAASCVGLAAVTLSIALYYRHFTPLYAERLRAASAPAIDRPADPPIQRAEAHQTRWAPGWAPLWNRVRAVPGYASKYLGAVLILMACAGIVSLWRSRASDPLTILTIAWFATCIVFLFIGVLTPVDVRYYLASAPPVAILAGHAAAIMWDRGGVRRVVAIGAVLWCLVSGLIYWLLWFGPAPPR